MPMIKLEFEVVDAKECASTLRSTVKRIDWVLENNPPRNPRKPNEAELLDVRAKHLTLIATMIEMALYQQTGEKI